MLRIRMEGENVTSHCPGKFLFSCFVLLFFFNGAGEIYIELYIDWV